MIEFAKSISGLLAPVIALVTVSILVMQYRLSKQRWRLDLFDKRYEVYQQTKKYIRHINASAGINSEDLEKFKTKSRDSDFLFSESIREYLELLYDQGLRLQSNKKRMAEMTEEQDADAWARECDISKELLDWFSEQPEIAKEKFAKYLKLEKR